MSYATLTLALVWGAIAGYFMLRVVDSLVAVGYCAHGLLKVRWNRLSKKVTTGQVRPEVILRLLARVGLYALLFLVLLQLGDRYVRRTFWFEYVGSAGLTFALAAAAMFFLRLRWSWHRLRIYWRISHEYDYAEKRQRTLLLRN